MTQGGCLQEVLALAAWPGGGVARVGRESVGATVAGGGLQARQPSRFRQAAALRWLARVAVLAVSLSLVAACGGSNGTSSDEGDRDPEADAAELLAVLTRSMQAAFLQSLVADPATVQGSRGRLTISGSNWLFEDYSPDGRLVMDGELTVEKDRFPTIPVRGRLTLSGSHQGTLVADLVVSAQTSTWATTGTLTLDGQVYDVGQLAARLPAAPGGPATQTR